MGGAGAAARRAGTMKEKIGFDNKKYLEMQSAHIRERIGQFGNKLYLEFGGKLFDDYHASRVLPGFAPDSKYPYAQGTAGFRRDCHRHLCQRHREKQGPGRPWASPTMWMCSVSLTPSGARA